MSNPPQSKNNAPLVVALVIVVLLGLGIALYFAFFATPVKKAPAPTPVAVQASPQPVAPEATPASTQPKILGVHQVVPRDTLWWISDKWYKDPVLWPSIYEINKAQIHNPDLIYPGQRFDIPALVGTKNNLSQDDYSLLAKGYLEAYRVYKEAGKKDASQYKTAGERYQAKASQ